MNSKIAIASSALPNGTRLGEFEITGVVGEGGFGIVYSAHDTTLERIVAVKEYLPSAFASRTADGAVKIRSEEHRKTFDAGLASFINEAKMLAKFAHPGLVEVFRFWEANGTAYMAMRYYRGVTLRETIRNDPNVITETWLCQTLDPILLALRELHEEQCFHRDIAPDNIMVLPNGKSVLMDFGAARRIIGGMTRALTTVLKPGYAPIEQYSDDGAMQQGAWTDIYALGGVLYHAMTGKVPVQAISRMMADPLKDVATMARAPFSPSLCNAVMKSLAVMPENRFQTIDELRAALGWVTTPLSSTVIVTSPPVLPKTPSAPVATPAMPPVPSVASISKPSGVPPVAVPPVAPKTPSPIDDLLAKKPTSKPNVKIMTADDPDEITVVGDKSKGSKSKVASVKETEPKKTETSESVASTPKKGLSAGVLVGIGLALIVISIAAFLLTGRGSPTTETTSTKPTPTKTAETTPRADPPAATQTITPSTPATPPDTTVATVAPVPQTALPTATTPSPADPPATNPAQPADTKSDTPAIADGILRVTVTGGWAAISINGEPQGVTPKFNSKKLAPGIYTVEFTNPTQPKITKTVEVIAGKTSSVRHAY